MSEEEVIERLHNFKSISILYSNTFVMHIEQLKQLQEDLDTVLQLLEQKDNKINKVIEYIKDNAYDMHDGTFIGMTKDEVEKILKILEE